MSPSVTPAQTRVLVLGGTAEGRELATELAGPSGAGVEVISSLAGRVSAPRLPPGRVRTGGFGGADGLAGFLTGERISAVVDATHPFAARISANAREACERTGVPLLVLDRPPWTPEPGDDWTTVADPAEAAGEIARLPAQTRVLLTIGRQGVAAFAAANQQFWVRAVEPPEGPLPPRSQVLLDRGPFTRAGELELLRRLGIERLVTKNSGGPLTAAKLTAARECGVPVVMIRRPGNSDTTVPTVPTVTDVASAVTWVAGRVAGLVAGRTGNNRNH